MSVLSDVANMAECGQEMALKQYNGAIGGSIGRAPTLSENLMARKEQLEAQLSRVNAALAALEKNPNFEEMINLLAAI